jgi:pimeloyl-ACP methyl ester carboxylesterase
MERSNGTASSAIFCGCGGSVKFHQDKMIPPPAQRAMAGRAKAQVTEVPGSHAIYVSKPAEVAEVIQQAADASI